jgi:hypothetical protein
MVPDVLDATVPLWRIEWDVKVLHILLGMSFDIDR